MKACEKQRHEGTYSRKAHRHVKHIRNKGTANQPEELERHPFGKKTLLNKMTKKYHV